MQYMRISLPRTGYYSMFHPGRFKLTGTAQTSVHTTSRGLSFQLWRGAEESYSFTNPLQRSSGKLFIHLVVLVRRGFGRTPSNPSLCLRPWWWTSSKTVLTFTCSQVVRNIFACCGLQIATVVILSIWYLPMELSSHYCVSILGQIAQGVHYIGKSLIYSSFWNV